MVERHVVVRLPTVGTVLGGILRDHPGSTIRTVTVPAREPGTVRFRAAVAGLPASALERLRLEWHLQYGTDPVPLDGSADAWQMTLPLERIVQPEMARLLQLEPQLTVLGNVASGSWVEQWLSVPPGEASRVTELVQRHLSAVPDLQVRPARPAAADVAAWQALKGGAATQAPGPAAAAPQPRARPSATDK